MDRIIAGGQYLLTGNTRSSAPFYPLHFLATQGGTGEVSEVGNEIPGAGRGLDLEASPNPFNPLVTIRFKLPVAAETSVEMFDVRGRKVADLGVKRREAGLHHLQWDGTDPSGRKLASGVYLTRVRTDSLTETLKVVLAK